MLAKKILLPILLSTLTPALFADSLSEDEIKKALEGITQITVMASAEPKIISEVSIKATPEKTKTVHKKRVHKKRVHKKRRVVKKHEDLSDLPMAKTLGVTETSKVFTGNY